MGKGRLPVVCAGLAVVLGVAIALRLLGGGDAGGPGAGKPAPEESSQPSDGRPSLPVPTLPAPGEGVDGETTPEAHAALPRVPSDTPAAQPLASPTVSLAVRVLDGDGRPIAGAELLAGPAGSTPQRFRPDAAGLLDVPLAAPVGMQLVARAEGFAPLRVDSERIAEHVAAGRRLDLVLQRVDRLYGRLALSGPIAVPEGVVVVASRGTAPPTREALLAALAAEAEPLPELATLLAEVAAGTSPQVMVTRTLQGGRFAFPRPVPAGRWQLEAGGLGVATNGPLTLSVPLGEAVVLRGHSAHAVAVQLRDVHGNSLTDLPADLRLGASMSPGDKWFPCDFTPVVRLLLGIEWRPEWGSGQLVEAVAPQWEEEVGPLRVGLAAPGYEAVPLELMLPNVRHGLREERITLLAVAGRFGELELHLPGWTAGIGSAERVPDITLHLKSGSGERLQRRVRDLVDDRLVLTALPQGDYEASLEIACYLGTSHAPQPVTIADERVLLEFPLTELGTLEVECVTPDQLGYAGRLDVFIGWKLETGSLAGDMAHFDAPPYRVPFLRPGAWLVKADLAWSAEGQRFMSRLQPVELSAGGTTRASVQLEPRP